MSVFISYSRKDSSFAQRLSTRLIQNNIKVWKDDMKISPGESLSDKIKIGIDKANYFLPVISENSIKSKWVKTEITQALIQEAIHKGKTIIPLVLDDCQFPESLKDRLFVDFKNDFEAGVLQVLSTIGDKYNIKNSGRVDINSSYCIDYGIEEGLLGGRFFMQIDIVSFDREEDFSILTQFKFNGNEHVTPEGLELKTGDSVRDYILRACAEEFRRSPARITLDSQSARNAKLFIQDAEGKAKIELTARFKWLGSATRETLLFNVGALFEQLVESCECATRNLSADGASRRTNQ